MIRIKIDLEGKELRRARFWCRENFGEIPLKDTTEKVRRKIMANVNYQYFGGKVYDNEKARWIHRFNKPEIFHFRHEEDAMAFKLMWL